MNPVTPRPRRRGFLRENSPRTAILRRLKRAGRRGSNGVKVLLLNRTTFRIPGERLREKTQRIIVILKRLGLWEKRRYAISLVFVSDRESQALNTRFRKKGKPSNVLSFDYGAAGELVLAPKLIRREARALGQSFFTRLIHLIVHGLLHLSGAHHERSPTLARRFERLELLVFERLQ